MEREEPQKKNYENKPGCRFFGFGLLLYKYPGDCDFFFPLWDFWFIFHNKNPNKHSVKQNEGMRSSICIWLAKVCCLNAVCYLLVLKMFGGDKKYGKQKIYLPSVWVIKYLREWVDTADKDKRTCWTIYLSHKRRIYKT